jgi:ParB family chromosome partitioning protein
MEEAYAYYRLAEDFGHTQERIAELTGKSRSHVANFMRLTNLDTTLQEMLANGALSVGHAKLLAGTEDQEALAQEIVAKGLTVRQVEEMLRARVASPRARRRAAAPDVDREALEQQLGEVTGLDVAIRVKSGPAGTKGELVVRFRDLEELDHVIAKLQA